MRQVRLQGVTCGHRENFEAMLRAVEAHGIDPVISHRFAFAEAREAFACMAGNDHLGKIVIDVAGS
jgi:D-arabinose 1-dehydrogenase-like Zn-dependent alcohol dehydrogenase